MTASVSWAGQHLGQLDVRFGSATRWTPGDELRLRAVARSTAAAVTDARLREHSLRQAELAAYAAHHDPLTGLGNRRMLVSEGEQVLRRAGEAAGLAALVLV
nr:hypothetical protein [Micromonospora sp. DSM 115978]